MLASRRTPHKVLFVIPAMTTRPKTWLSLAAFAVCVAMYYPFSPGGRQSANMRKADEHAIILKPRLAADPRFVEVELSAMTAGGGCLLITGEVAARSDVEALKSLIAESKPPVEVMYVVSAKDAPATRPQG